MTIEIELAALRVAVVLPWQTVVGALLAWATSFSWLLWTCRRQS